MPQQKTIPAGYFLVLGQWEPALRLENGDRMLNIFGILWCYLCLRRSVVCAWREGSVAGKVFSGTKVERYRKLTLIVSPGYLGII